MSQEVDLNVIFHSISRMIDVTEKNIEKNDELRTEIGAVARSVHELAMSLNFRSEQMAEIKEDLAQVKKSVSTLTETVKDQQPTINMINKIGDLILKWIVPIALVGMFVGGLSYTIMNK